MRPKSQIHVAARSLTAIPGAHQAPKTGPHSSQRHCWKARLKGWCARRVELAKAGNVVMLKFFLERILPRDRLIQLDLPEMNFADDAVEALGHIMRAVSDGRITPSEAAALATLVNSYTRAIDMADVVKRMDSLEAQIKAASRAMSQTRFRRIARLEKLAKPYLELATADRTRMAADSSRNGRECSHSCLSHPLRKSK